MNLSAQTVSLSSDSGVYLNTGSGFSSTKSSAWPLPTFGSAAANFLEAPFFAAQIDGAVWGTGRIATDLTGDGRIDIVGGALVLDPQRGDFLNASGQSRITQGACA